MSLAPGTKLAHFEIVEPIGAGGMGEVYRAHDRKLDRDVAIKVLPEELSRDPERLARFAREAKLLASLNHPNIAHVYGFESSMLPDGSAAHFLAMELVPGEDLAERLARGPIPVDETLAIAKQIADALEEAHEKGIVHRDLKPANVKLTPDGKVKVLDFGLAKAYAGDGLSTSASDLSQSPTLAHAGTQAGVILGTAGYMSPEQARGKAVDKRADIWSFGVVLFEMLTGKRLFDGETVSDVLAAVLTKEPDWSALPSTTPAGSVRLLRRCLERDPRQRLRDIGEARIALETTNLAEPVSVAAPARGYRGLAMAMIAAALALTAAGVAVGLWLRAAPRVVRKLDITDVQMRTDNTLAPVLSPNGERVLYFSQEGLRVRELNQAEARTLVDSDGITSPFWSPDGREIGFFKEGGLYRVSLDGGAPQLIAQTGPAVSGAGAAWDTDGRIVYAVGNAALFGVSARGGEPRVLLEPDGAKREDHFHGGSFLPGGRAFVFVVHQLDTPPNALAVFEGGRTRVLLELEAQGVSQPVFSPSGHIVFSTRGAGQDGVWALPFSLSRLEPTGDPFLIAPGASSPSVAADGSLLYVPARPRRPVPLIWVSRSGQREGIAVEFPGDLMGIALSRDGKRVAAAVGDAFGSDIWIADLERGSRTRLTVGAQGQTTARAPAWSPDGARIAFYDQNRVSAVRGGSIWVVPADGSSEPRVVGRGLQPFFGADGRTILAHRPHVESRRRVYEIVSLDATGESEPRVVLTDSVSVRFPLLSPDGRFLAYDRGDGDEVDSFLTRFPGVEGRWQVSATRGTFLRWSPDGKRLYYFAPTPGGSDEGLFEVEVGADGTPSLGIPRFLFTLSSVGAAAEEYEVGPSGDRFLMIAREQGDALAHLVLVQDWFAEFQ